MTFSFTEADIEHVLQNGDLIVDRNINWRAKKDQDYYEFSVPVRAN